MSQDKGTVGVFVSCHKCQISSLEVS